MKEVLAAPAGSSARASANMGLGPHTGPPAKHPLTGLTPGDHHRHYCKPPFASTPSVIKVLRCRMP